MLTTTLQTIWDQLYKENGEIVNGDEQCYWNSLLEGLGKPGPDDEPVTLLRVLESCGLRTVLGTFDAFPENERALRLFACNCARYILPSYEKECPEDQWPRHAIEAAEKFARGLVPLEEMRSARSGLWNPTIKGFSGYFSCAIGEAADYCSNDARRIGDIAYAVYSGIITMFALPWTLAQEAAEIKCRENLRQELIRLCKLEGEYGEVDRLGKA